MGTDNYEAGFKKLWKLLSHLDQIVSKMNELEIVHFLSYNDMFESLA